MARYSQSTIDKNVLDLSYQHRDHVSTIQPINEFENLRRNIWVDLNFWKQLEALALRFAEKCYRRFVLFRIFRFDAYLSFRFTQGADQIVHFAAIEKRSSWSINLYALKYQYLYLYPHLNRSVRSSRKFIHYKKAYRVQLHGLLKKNCEFFQFQVVCKAGYYSMSQFLTSKLLIWV